MKLKYLLAASAVSLTAAVALPAPVMAQQITSGVPLKSPPASKSKSATDAGARAQ